MRKLLVLVSIIAAAALLCGCCACNFNGGTSKNIFTLSGNSFEETEITPGENTQVSYSVSSSGPGVDIYVLDEENYRLLKAGSEDWHAIYSDYAEPEISGEFMVPTSGTYYFVVYNYNEKSATVNTDLKW